MYVRTADTQAPLSLSLGAGFVYPTYASYKAIRTNEHQAIETWLMYWVVMGVVVAAEHSVEWAVRWCVAQLCWLC